MENLPDGLSLVHGTAIPDHNYFAAETLHQITEEVRGPLGIYETTRICLPVEAQSVSLGRDRQGSRYRHLLPMCGLGLQNRRVSTRRQRASYKGRHQKAAFVDQNEVGTPTPGTFFIRGHSSRSHRRTSRPFRSRACRSGFWEVIRRSASHLIM